MDVRQAINWKVKDKLYVSLALHPGTTGEQFYKTLFEHHGINAEYVACACTDLEQDMKLVREHCAGASITMPYKKQVEKYLDMSWTAFMPVNTVVNKDKFLSGYNCDYLGLKDVLQNRIKDKTVIILGDGAMADNAALICMDAKKVTVASRRKDTWSYRHNDCDVLINTTSIGMNTDESPVNRITANLVVDCVIGQTELIKQAHSAGKAYITGADIYTAQFKHQFQLYTGIEPDAAIVKLIAKKVFDV